MAQKQQNDKEKKLNQWLSPFGSLSRAKGRHAKVDTPLVLERTDTHEKKPHDAPSQSQSTVEKQISPRSTHSLPSELESNPKNNNNSAVHSLVPRVSFQGNFSNATSKQKEENATRSTREMFYMKFNALLSFYKEMGAEDVKRELEKIEPLFHESQFIEGANHRPYVHKTYDVQKVVILQRAVRKFLAVKRKETKLRYSLAEVVETELTYGQTLTLLSQKFRQPLLQQKYTKQEVDTIFGNLDELIDLNRNLIRDLKKKDAVISQVFMVHISVIRNVFSKYAINMQASIEFLKNHEKRMAPLLMKIYMDRELRQLHLEDFLIHPIKRVPLYVLMLRNVLSHLQPEDFRYISFCNCIQVLERVASEVDQKKSEADGSRKLSEIAAKLQIPPILLSTLDDRPRIFVKEGTLTLITPEKQNHQFFYMFTDLLICEAAYQFQGFIYLQDAVVNPLEDFGELKFAFQIVKKDQKKFTFLAKSELERGQWIKQLRTQTVIRDSISLMDDLKTFGVFENRNLAKQNKSGILRKQLLTGGWQLTFCVVEPIPSSDQQTKLSYYKIQNQGKTRSLIPKSISLQNFYLLRGPYGLVPSFQIHLVNKDPNLRSFALAADNESEMNSWLEALRPHCLEAPKEVQNPEIQMH